jgi:hypothetical protein
VRNWLFDIMVCGFRTTGYPQIIEVHLLFPCLTPGARPTASQQFWKNGRLVLALLRRKQLVDVDGVFVRFRILLAQVLNLFCLAGGVILLA